MDGTALQGLPALPATGVALDGADAVADEQALLHLLNAVREAGLPVLLAARAPPARWPVRLPDLASRLRAITAVQILPPDGSLLRALLRRLLSDRQLRVDADVQDWLPLRLPRSPGVLREAVARPDHAELPPRGKVTRAVARGRGGGDGPRWRRDRPRRPGLTVVGHLGRAYPLGVECGPSSSARRTSFCRCWCVNQADCVKTRLRLRATKFPIARRPHRPE